MVEAASRHACEKEAGRMKSFETIAFLCGIGVYGMTVEIAWVRVMGLYDDQCRLVVVKVNGPQYFLIVELDNQLRAGQTEGQNSRQPKSRRVSACAPSE